MNINNPEFETDHTMGSYFLYVLPAIILFLFNGVYTIADGIFIERFVGPYAIGAVNLYYPILTLTLATGSMIGAGGAVNLASLLGAGKKEEADRLFSQLITAAAVTGLVISVFGNLFDTQILSFLGATEGNYGYAYPYYKVLVTTCPVLMFASVFVPFIFAEGKTLAISLLSVAGGILNIVLDYVFMGIFGTGIAGAAWASTAGYAVPGLYALIFYSGVLKDGSSLRYRLCRPKIKKLIPVFYNGSSELITNIAAGVTALIMNHLSYRFFKEVGVSVSGIFLYVQFLIMSVFMGMTQTIEPAISYQYGKGDTKRAKDLYVLSMKWTAVFSAVIFVLLFFLHDRIVLAFFDDVSSEKDFYDLSIRCLMFTLPACLICGFNIFIQGLFTAYLNGTVSLILSSLRTFVLFAGSMYFLSMIMGADGLWLAWFAAELITLIVSVCFLQRYRKSYGL
ncbi:MAG: hypothetical protein K6G22_01290 [Lachnospiraceae bacterium]|nr:hypothetical protein [Lachnospiraceae bacterium]